MLQSKADPGPLADTLTDTGGATLGAASISSARSTASRRTTVLPRVYSDEGAVRLVPEPRDRYETERVLGEGGMGVVDLARDQDIDRPVAIKRVRSEVAGDLGVARFVEEVRTIGSLEHPNIVPVHDVGLDEQGRFFLVMKYVEGETLERIIERLDAGDPEAHRAYPFEARVRIFLGLLHALAYAHDRGIIHRDIKPANVMVGPYGEVVLMDWGVARAIGAADLPAAEDEAPLDDTAKTARRRLVATASSALVGTPLYMSPEQARGEPNLDARSDLYSACVLFQELLALRHYLADKTSLLAVISGVMTEDSGSPLDLGHWRHPKQSNPPAEWLHFVRRGMEKNRDARWQSAEEMIARVEETLGGKITVQCPVTMTKRMTTESSRFVDRHPLVAVGAFGVGVLGIVAGIAGGILAFVF